jgi:hypothetical protein
MAYMNRFNLSDEHRRNELIRIVEHSVESALAESRTSYCTIKGTDEDCLFEAVLFVYLRASCQE